MFSKFPIVTMSYPSTKHRIFGQHANQYSITLDAHGHLLVLFSSCLTQLYISGAPLICDH